MSKMSSLIELRKGYWAMNGNNVLVTNKESISDLGSLIEDNHPTTKDIVFIYNGNPFVSEETINTAIKNTEKYGAVMIVNTCPDTLKIVDENNFIKQTLNRREYGKIQLRAMTYDFFKRRIMEPLMEHDIIKKVFEIVSKTDLVRQFNKEIKWIREVVPQW